MTVGAPLVLIADDFADASEMYSAYLRFHGFRVVTAVDGNDAVKAAREHKPDLVLLDVRMPIMGGMEAMRILKADPEFAHTPIVALTAHAMPNERDAALQAGFDGYWSKPMAPDQLLTHIRSVLGKA